MPRPPKKVEAATSAPRAIDPESFTRVRDSVYGRMSTLQDLMKGIAVDFLRQTNLLLGVPTDLGTGAELAALDQAVLSLSGVAPAPELPAPAEEKKERKKRTHDPNAPKRPLTPYFLYMQTARPIIAGDLGAEAPKGAVQEEGQRRWASMTPGEKAGWNQAYQYNLRLYNARVHSYKAGNPLAKDMGDGEALKYADDFRIPLPTVSGVEGAPAADDDTAHIDAQLGQTIADDSSKTPKKKDTRKRKSGVEEPEVSVVKNTPASPDKKRKRASKVAEEKEEPKKAPRKKTKA